MADPRSETDNALYEHLLDEATTALGAGDRAGLANCVELLIKLAPQEAAVFYLHGHLAWLDSGAKAAADLFERAAAAAPNEPDFHHALGCALSEVEDARARARAREAFARTLSLDEALDRMAGRELADCESQIERVAASVLDQLPEHFRQHLSNVPVIIEPRPCRASVAQDFDPRALGMFEGSDQAESQQNPVVTMPTRIVLYARNLLASFPDPDELAQQVEITILHEIGHYFGLGEDEVEALGLK